MELRNDEKFFELYNIKHSFAQNSKIPTPSSDNLSPSNRTRKNLNNFADYYVITATGRRMDFSSDNIKTKQKIYIFQCFRRIILRNEPTF